MTHTYNITGLTCNGCVAKAKSELLKLGDITEANVQLAPPQATLSMQKHIATADLQKAISQAGHYTITEANGGMKHSHHHAESEEARSWLQTYKPVLLIFGYVLVISLIAAAAGGGFHVDIAMRVFMSGFFIAFSFFKMLDLSAFADSYATYDIIAKRYRGWGFIYAFIELLLGISYAVNSEPLLTNIVTLAVMLVSIVGVLQSLLNKRSIQCACLGAVFNLPMSAITLIEDGLMIAMSGIMIAFYLA